MITQFLNAWVMTLSAFIVAFIFYITRRNKYSITWPQLFLVALILCIGGTVGNSIWSVLTQGNLEGRRAYGMVLLDTILLLPTAQLLKRKDGSLTDYASIPAAAICLTGKTQCVFEGCCYGIVIYTNEIGYELRLPIQTIEAIALFLILIWLIHLENKGNAHGFLWSLNMLWYGMSRYLADLFRGNPKERVGYLLNMQAGQFWSLVIIIWGCLLMYLAFRKRYHRNPTVSEYIAAVSGQYPIE